jgi:hypothetical protein
MPVCRTTLPALLSLALLTALPSHAQGITVTAYGGWRGSGAGLQRSAPGDPAVRLGSGPAAAMSIDWTIDAARQLQLFGSHQQTELETSTGSGAGTPLRVPLKLSTVQLGGTNFIDGRVGNGTYVVGGLGFTQLSPGLAGLESELRLSLSLGLGYQWPLSAGLSLRTELRGWGTLINSGGSFLCSGGCTVSIKGETLTQVEALLGLAWNF